MDIDYAKQLIDAGVRYGEVYPQLDDAAADGDELRRHFVCGTPRVGVVRPAPAAPTGKFCDRCGGQVVRTGTCETCTGCAASSGGCS